MSSVFHDDLFSAETHGYKLPIEDLLDGTKLKKHVVSMQTVANIAQVVTQSSPIPGLSIAGYTIKAVRTKMRLLNGTLVLPVQSFESFDRVQRCR